MAGHRVRTPLVFTAAWEGAIERWANKFIEANKWRCDSIHSTDDLLQDAYLVFVKIAEKYPKVTEAKNFMRLFQIALRNSFHDHSRYMMKKRGVLVETLTMDATEYYNNRIGEVSNNGYLNALMAEAPEEVLLALAAFADPVCCSALRQKGRKQKRKLRLRENLNMRLRRVTGVPKDFDLVSAIKALLT